MKKSNHYLFIEAAVQRILPNDPEAAAFQEEFYRMKAGFAGEKKLKNTLKDFSFKSDYSIFYNFECVNDRGFTHQIDALLITPYFILIFEVKQLSGKLSYKPVFHEFTRITENQTRDNFPNPFDQVYRHKLFIKQFLQKLNITMPVLQLVVIANYRAELDVSLEGFPIIHLSGLPRYLEKLYAENNHKKVNITDICSKLKMLIQPLPARKTIARCRLKSGVLCQKCEYMGRMHYQRGIWQCEKCHSKSRVALHEALHHYRVLISPRISNKEFREFTGIKSTFAASKILARLNFEKYGATKGRYYLIPEDIYYKGDD